MTTIDFPEQQTELVTFSPINGLIICRCMGNERTFVNDDGEARWQYDLTTFEFTPGHFLSQEVILKDPDTFLVLSGNVDEMATCFINRGQKYIDDWAVSRGYDNCHTACGYKTSSVPRFKAEANILSNLRDEVWVIMQHLQARAINGDARAIMQLFNLPEGLPTPDFSDVPEVV